ncbi:unnamed protein product [Adineta steineri]|uniref:Purple acid phosphatase n=2 Tax=Adineta steineri TaxID=433720 RepID=A0A819NIU4_9BILA|nr:unnamed protein product [Adineta steineri]CAF3994186.1 unnamed protein product [Adineta steineri]
MFFYYALVCFFLVVVIVIITGEEHVHINGPFGKIHSDIEIPSPFNCNRSIGISSDSLSVRIIDLQVSSTHYLNKDFLDVSWIPLSNPCKDDFIGIYFVEIPRETGACDYVDYEFIQIDQNNSTWFMINLRRQLEFRYYSRNENCTGNYEFLGKSSIVEPSNFNEPTQVHLAFGDRNDEMFVSYVTNSNEVIPQCQYGFDSTSLHFQSNGTTITYQASDMCEGKANITGPQTFINPGYMHTILLNNLNSSTIYYYRVGNNEHGWSPIYHFINRPANIDDEVNLIAYGDMGVSPVQPGAKATIDRVATRIQTNNITAILHIGDVSYARGIGALWDAFMSQVEMVTSSVPYMVGIGNHEYDHVSGGEKDPSGAPGPGGFRPIWGNYGYDSGGECAVPIIRRFHSPSNGNGLFWYSFDIGPIHIVYYSTEHDFRRLSPQYTWLENDLRSVNRSRTPWLIVGSHRPMYTSLVVIDPIGLMLQLHIEPLLYKYQVDLNLYGHIHSYERTCPMYQHQCVENGITQILIGMGGHDLTYGNYSGTKWSLYHDIDFGYTHIWANKTYLIFNYYHTHDDHLVDQFHLNK